MIFSQPKDTTCALSKVNGGVHCVTGIPLSTELRKTIDFISPEVHLQPPSWDFGLSMEFKASASGKDNFWLAQLGNVKTEEEA